MTDNEMNKASVTCRKILSRLVREELESLRGTGEENICLKSNSQNVLKSDENYKPSAKNLNKLQAQEI